MPDKNSVIDGLKEVQARMADVLSIPGFNRVQDAIDFLEVLTTRPQPVERALQAIAGAMLQGGDGETGDFGWSITKLNKARPLIRSALEALTTRSQPGDVVERAAMQVNTLLAAVGQADEQFARRIARAALNAAALPVENPQ